MHRGRSTRSVVLCACTMALALLGCASGSANPTARSSQRPRALVNSPAMGLVGLLVMDPKIGPPRAAGMQGMMVGYVVSHPALLSDLSARRPGQTLSVLAFKLTMDIVPPFAFADRWKSTRVELQ